MLEPWTPSVIWIVVLAYIIAFLLAFGVGANDVANSFGTSVGARVLTLRQACMLATFFEIAGAVLLGYSVSETVRKGIIDVSLFADDERELMLGSLAAMIGSVIWNLSATALALPISGTHTVVGATIGFSLVARGAAGIRWLTLAKIVGSWFVSPLLSGLASIFIFKVVKRLVLNAEQPIASGLRLLPVLFGIAVLLNVYSIVHDGPKLLALDRLPLWAAVLVAASVGVLTAVAVQCWLVPRIRRQSEKAAGLGSEKPPQVISEGHKNASFSGDMLHAGSPPDYGTATANDPVPNGNGVPAHTPTPAPDAALSLSASSDSDSEQPDKHAPLEDVPGEAMLFAPVQILTACFGSFAHGGNDVSNAVGPLIAIWMIYTEGSALQEDETPVYILVYGGIGIAIGLWVWGRRVMRTIGEDLTRLTPASGFSIELGAAATVLLASKAGLPISTTHCKVGSVVLVGWACGGAGGVSWKLFGGIATAWLLTVPVAAGGSAAVMAIFEAAVL